MNAHNFTECIESTQIKHEIRNDSLNRIIERFREMQELKMGSALEKPRLIS